MPKPHPPEVPRSENKNMVAFGGGPDDGDGGSGSGSGSARDPYQSSDNDADEAGGEGPEQYLGSDRL